MTVEYNSHVVQDGLDRLTAVFKEKPRIEGLLRACIQEFQNLEDALDYAYNQLSIANKVGEELDIIGYIVGEPRSGRNDDSYRIAIRAKIGINISRGTPNEVITIFDLLTGSTSTSLLEYVAAVSVTGNTDFSADAVAIRAALQKVLSSGVRLYYIATSDSLPHFAFKGFPGGAGFGDINNPGGGGTFVSIVGI